MQFTDIVFALFMGVFFCFYWFVFRNKLKLQNVWLLCSSYLFYGWWDWRFLILIVLTSFSTFSTAILFERFRNRGLIYGNIILNLGILAVFKYFNFFSENIARLFSLFGVGLDWFTLDVLLPVGISFYTFQAIGYSVDVMRGNFKPTHNLVGFFTYIAFFPQLVAGPIESARNLLPQILRKREWDTHRGVEGLRMILFGLLKKVCVADMLAIYVDRIFDSAEMSPLLVLAGGILFSIQLYCDFSAYSEIARGCASLLGIQLMVNFRFPLFSRNILEFWRRWHISLMLWFRDYVYIPLGGNRKGEWRTVANYSVVFLLSGLWHGAAWNFVFWGVYWAICYIIGNYMLRLQRRPEGGISLYNMPDIVLTFGVVVFGFYIFRCDSIPLIITGLKYIWVYILFFGALSLLLKGLLFMSRGVRLNGKVLTGALIILSMIILVAAGKGIFLLKFWWILPALMVFAIEWRDRNSDYPFSIVPSNKYARYILYWVMGTFIVLSEPTEMSFIYFQF